MEGLSLQIADKWAVLDEGVSISVEENSPIWGEGNSFSFPFELDVESNRHIIGNSDQLTGESVYKVLDGQPAVLYVMGVPLYYGKISLDDEVEIADGRVEVTLISGNLTFDEMIDGMNCQDVPLKDEIVLGKKWDTLFIRCIEKKTLDGALGPRTFEYSSAAPRDVMAMEDSGKQSTINVSSPYPQKAYCNTRIAYKKPEKEKDAKLSKENEEKAQKMERGNYLVLDANRTESGPCFYVLYFLECLFRYLKIAYNLSNIRALEDIDRLAFFNAKFKYKLTDPIRSTGWPETFKISYDWPDGADNFLSHFNIELENTHYYCIATSENFPNIEVSQLIKSLSSAFLIKLYIDRRNIQQINAVYIKDILKDNDIQIISSVEIIEANKIENDIKGYRLSYSSADDDNTEYNYNDWSNPLLLDSYNEIKSNVKPFNKRLYIHNKNGNAYRIKVNGESTSIADLNEALFEVGAYNSVSYGDCSDENKTENTEIGFSPITVNDVFGSQFGDDLVVKDDQTKNDQLFAALLDVEMKYPKEYTIEFPKITIWQGLDIRRAVIKYTFFLDQPYSEEATLRYKKFYSLHPEGKVYYEGESPVQACDTGFMLGLMRGPGREAGVEEFDENYDEEGNSKYVVVSSDYAFHSDYVDNYARLFDYNGTEPGGVDTTGRISLKLRSEKPVPTEFIEADITYEEFYSKWKAWGISDDDIDAAWNVYVSDLDFYRKNGYFPITETYAQKRGLFDKFHAEYAYFVINRKIVRLTLRMELADLASIDWTKRYKIGDYVGFVNKYSYTVDNTGMSDVTLEMYYL